MRIAGTTALVTGATGAIGQAIARALAAQGAAVVLSGRRSAPLRALAEELGGRAITADLDDTDGPAALMDTAGPVDILVANAGLFPVGPFTDRSIDDIDRVLAVNLRAPLVLARLAAVPMVRAGSGHIVVMSSMSGKVVQPGLALYNTTKFALRGMALALREDLRPHGVGVSGIYPGVVRQAGMAARAGLTAPRLLGSRTCEDVARAVVRAIGSDAAEVDVASPVMRWGARFAGVAPGLSSRVQRLVGMDEAVRRASGGGPLDRTANRR
ncbi:SDR family NAD(P)-dependent oxidoreductase [Spirillospora sp. NPDC050679]